MSPNHGGRERNLRGSDLAVFGYPRILYLQLSEIQIWWLTSLTSTPQKTKRSGSDLHGFFGGHRGAHELLRYQFLTWAAPASHCPIQGDIAKAIAIEDAFVFFLILPESQCRNAALSSCFSLHVQTDFWMQLAFPSLTNWHLLIL